MGAGFTIIANDFVKRNPNLSSMKLDPENSIWLIVVVKDTNTKAKKLFDKVFQECE